MVGSEGMYKCTCPWTEAISDDVLRETDVAYEQELQQNPYSVKLWGAYVKAKLGICVCRSWHKSQPLIQ